MMRFLLSALILSLASGLTAAEPADSSEIRAESTERTGLVARFDSMRQNMSSAATELVVNAMGFLGVPYKFGGNTVDTGFDCSGFVRSIYEQSFGLLLPRRAAEQARATTEISREELKPGDLVFFNTMRSAFSHVGIYIGDNKFIHSPRTGERVRVDDMRQSYWTARFNGARRVEAGSNLLAPSR